MSVDAVELSRVVGLASRLYYSALMGPSMAAHRALGYLADRRVFAPTIDAFRLGYVPRQKTPWLLERLRDVPQQTLVDAGLLVESQHGGLVDPMQGRIVFPQTTASGTVVGFVGRAIDPSVLESYKYVASPVTPIFRRTELLYRVDMAQRSIVAEGKAILVEGPLDAILLYQVGRQNTVALGTKRMTDAQAQVLARYAMRLDVMFDTGEEEDKAFDRLRRSHGHYFHAVDRIRVPPKYDDPAQWVAATIDSRLTG